jgi:hypothetical protein
LKVRQKRDKDVVAPAPATIHADPDAVIRQQAREGGTGELSALVGGEDLRPAVERDRTAPMQRLAGSPS